jgi:hypothetical protein
VQNYDLCNNTIQFGGYPDRAYGYLLSKATTSPTTNPTASGRRRLVNSVPAPLATAINATILDNQDGSYTYSFVSTESGLFDLYLYFGVGCFNNDNTSMGFNLTAGQTSNTTCFSYAQLNAASFLPTTPAPTYGDDAVPTGLPQAALTGIGVAAGVIGGVGCFAIAVGIRFRNRWRRDKEFIDAGRIAAAERGVQYLGDNELDRLQTNLQKTLEEIQKERAKRAGPEDQQDVIRALLRQKGELQEQVRQLKIRAQGGDPTAPEQELGALGRVRKSFAASRISRLSVSRTSRGMSLFRGAASPVAEGQVENSTMLESSNPVFAHERTSVRSSLSAALRGFTGRAALPPPQARGTRGASQFQEVALSNQAPDI